MEAGSSKPAQRRDANRTPRVECLVNAHAALAQGLVWDTAGHRLFWVDSPLGQIFSVSLNSGVIQTWTLPCPVGAIALCSDGRILALLLDGIYLFDPRTYDLHFLAAIETERAFDGQSFGLVGPDHAFWINVPGRAAVGSLHRLSMDGTVIQVTATKTVAPSGFGWSADGRTMYGADMDGGWISRWAFDPGTSGLSHGTRIVTRGKYLAAPGGGAVDAEGSYWSCDVAAGCVSRFSPDGQVLKQILLPVPAPTTCCFGGGDMRLLFVASRRSRLGGEQLCRSPTSGGIFMVQTEVAGVPVRRFELDAGWSVDAGLPRAAPTDTASGFG